MYNSAVEQFEIVPFLSLALPKIDNVSLFTQSFDLPNSLLSFIFVMFLIILLHELSIHELIHAVILDKWKRIPSDTQDRINQAIEEVRRLFSKGKQVSLTTKEMKYLLELVQYLLKMQVLWQYLSKKEVEELREIERVLKKALK